MTLLRLIKTVYSFNKTVVIVYRPIQRSLETAPVAIKLKIHTLLIIIMFSQ